MLNRYWCFYESFCTCLKFKLPKMEEEKKSTMRATSTFFLMINLMHPYSELTFYWLFTIWHGSHFAQQCRAYSFVVNMSLCLSDTTVFTLQTYLNSIYPTLIFWFMSSSISHHLIWWTETTRLVIYLLLNLHSIYFVLIFIIINKSCASVEREMWCNCWSFYHVIGGQECV